MTTGSQLEISIDLNDLCELFAYHFSSLTLLSMVADDRVTVGELVDAVESLVRAEGATSNSIRFSFVPIEVMSPK